MTKTGKTRQLKNGTSPSEQAPRKQAVLSIEQLNAIDLLIVGKPDHETATAVGVSRQTVNQWRNRNAAFIAELNARRQALWDASAERMRALCWLALDAIEVDLRSSDPAVVRKMAMFIIRHVPFGDLTPVLELLRGWAKNADPEQTGEWEAELREVLRRNNADASE